MLAVMFRLGLEIGLVVVVVSSCNCQFDFSKSQFDLKRSKDDFFEPVKKVKL